MGTPREDHPDAVRRSRIAAAGEKCIMRLQRRIISALEDAETILTETQRDRFPVCGSRSLVLSGDIFGFLILHLPVIENAFLGVEVYTDLI